MKAVCTHCETRRASRHCPALGGAICGRCCGEARLTQIDCPVDCPHLERNELFQRDKQRIRYREAWGRVNADLRDRQADLRILLMLEGVVLGTCKDQKAVTDDDLAKALGDLRTVLSPLELIRESPSGLSRRLIDEMTPLADEVGIEPVREAIGRMEKVLALVADPDAPRAFLQGLSAYAQQPPPRPALRRSPGLIVTPDELRRG